MFTGKHALTPPPAPIELCVVQNTQVQYKDYKLYFTPPPPIEGGLAQFLKLRSAFGNADLQSDMCRFKTYFQIRLGIFSANASFEK